MTIRPTWIATALMLLGLSSCGGPSGLYPVSGKVTYKGEPASGATLTFHMLGDKGSGLPDGVFPTAVVGDDGTFSLSSGEAGSGAPAGSYKVLVLWMDGLPNDAAPESKGKSKANRRAGRGLSDKQDFLPSDRLKGRYSNLSKPILSAEVKAERNDLPPIELKD